MNKIFMICSLCLLFAITSCGDAKPTGERLPDSEVSDEDIVDITPETSDEESADEETSDETTEDVENDDPDTTPEYDDEDIENDDFDTTPEYDDLDIELPECSASSETPCYDSSSGLIWSERSQNSMTWMDAIDYCLSYTEGGLSEWRLPNINELRTLIQNCPDTQTGGSCAVSDPDHLAGDDDRNDCYCEYYEDDRYSKFGEAGHLWSFSTVSDSTDYAWGVSFYIGGPGIFWKPGYNARVRCVR